jgi:hypothetical protein
MVVKQLPRTKGIYPDLHDLATALDGHAIHQLFFPNKHRSTWPLKLVYVDISGPMHAISSPSPMTLLAIVGYTPFPTNLPKQSLKSSRNDNPLLKTKQISPSNTSARIKGTLGSKSLTYKLKALRTSQILVTVLNPASWNG